MFLQLFPWVCSVWQPMGGSPWGFPLLLLLLSPERFIPYTHGHVTGTRPDQERSLWQAVGLSDGSSWALERPNGAQTISGSTVQVSSEHFLIQVVHSARWGKDSGVSNHGIWNTPPALSCHPDPWQTVTIPVSHGSLQWDRVGAVTRQGNLKNRQNYAIPKAVPCVFLPACCRASA